MIARIGACRILSAALAAMAMCGLGPRLAFAQDTAEAAISAPISASERMQVAVTIGAAGPYSFIVDTAAGRTVIAADLAQALALPPAGRARILSMTASRESAVVNVADLSYVAGQASSVRAFVLDGENIGAHGVLGVDALRGQRVVLDFLSQQLRVGPASERRDQIGPDDIVVRARRRYGQLVLADADVEGTPVDVVIDSGSAVSIGNEALRRLFELRHNQFQEIGLKSITGENFNAQYTQVQSLRIGGFRIVGLPIAFADAHFFRAKRLTRRPALLLGMDGLRMFDRVIVDFPNRRAAFVLPEGAPRG